MFEKGFFGGLFDFDGDGKLDDFERAVDFGAFMNLMENEKEDDLDEDDEDYDDE